MKMKIQIRQRWVEGKQRRLQVCRLMVRSKKGGGGRGVVGMMLRMSRWCMVSVLRLSNKWSMWVW
jgi:hypothetical protein